MIAKWNTDSGVCIQCFDSKLRNEYTSDPVPVTCVGSVEVQTILLTTLREQFAVAESWCDPYMKDLMSTPSVAW